MKKIIQTFSKSYPALKIKKNDLKEFVNIFSQELTELKLRINEFEYSDLEIQEIFQKNFDNLIINVFEITGCCKSENDSLYVSLSFKKNFIHFYMSNRDHVKRTVVEDRVHSILKERVFKKSGIVYSKDEFRQIISLYKDEIVEIIQTIVSNCDNYKIIIDDCEYTDQDQSILQTISNFYENAKEKKIQKLKIFGSVHPELSNIYILFNYPDDTISFSLSNISKNLEISDNSNIHLIGIQDTIEKILIKRKTLLYFFSSRIFYGIILAFSILLSYMLMSINLIKINQQIPVIGIIFFILGFIKFSDILYIKNTIRMRFENPPSTLIEFYQQNRSQILLALITAILTALVTVIITFIFTGIFPSHQ
jgi:hypothetical protein